MTDDEMIWGTLAGWPPRQPQPNIAPDNPVIEDSDHCGVITYTASRVSSTRPSIFGGYEHANPGWRRRRRLTCSEVILHFDNLGLVSGSYNGVIAINVDGALYREITIANAVARKYIRLGFPTVAQRLIEVIMPYSASIADAGITMTGAIAAPASSRLSLPRCVVLGDSRAQLFSASGIAKGWAEILCAAKGWQHINHGYGSSMLTPSWGTEAGELNPDVVISLTDYNDRTAQTPLATFKQSYKTLITNLRALKPTVKFHLIQSTWISAANDALTLKMADYRQAEADALTELADANNVLIDGLALTTVDDTTRFPDGIHPNDTGHAEMGAALPALVSL